MAVAAMAAGTGAAVAAMAAGTGAAVAPMAAGTGAAGAAPVPAAMYARLIKQILRQDKYTKCTNIKTNIRKTCRGCTHALQLLAGN